MPRLLMRNDIDSSAAVDVYDLRDEGRSVGARFVDVFCNIGDIRRADVSMSPFVDRVLTPVTASDFVEEAAWSVRG